MKANIESLEYLKKISGINNIGQTMRIVNVVDKSKLNTVSFDIKRYEELERDIFDSTKYGEWINVGKVELQKRKSNEIVNAVIKRRKVCKGSDSVNLRLAYNDENLIDVFLSAPLPHERHFGLNVTSIAKTPVGDDFLNLAKTVQILCSKESLKLGYGGKLQLKTGSNLALGYSEPLHWSRGFKPINYERFNEEQKIAYDAQMKNYYDSYVQSRKSGKTISQAKKAMSEKPMPSVKMTLWGDTLNSQRCQAMGIRYF